MVEKLTPMQQIGEKLLQKGVSILPIAPAQKYPARFDGTGWHAMGGWDQYGERLAVDAEIDAWETWPQCGVGVVLGPLSGLVVLDVDTDDPAIIAAIEAVTPPSWCKKRGSKGYAAFYQYNGETNGRFNAEVDGQTSRVVDLLSAGTQTVIPPSIHPNGDLYDWLTPFQLQEIQLDELPKLPPGYHDTLTAALVPWRGTARQSTHTGPLDIIEETELSQFDHEEIWKALDLIPYTDDDQFIRLGMALRQYGEQGFALWAKWCERWPNPNNYPDQETYNHIRGRWNSIKPSNNGVGVGSLWQLAKENGYVQQYERPTLLKAMHMWHTYDADYHYSKQPEPPRKTGLFAIPATKLGDLKPPAWIIKKHIIRDSLAMLYGASGAGKSFVAVDMGLSIASGRQWCNYKTNTGAVLYVAGEGVAGINARIIAWCQHHGIDKETLAETFHVTSQPVAILDALRVRELLKVIEELPQPPALIIIDTLNRNFGDGDENTTKDMTRFVDHLTFLQNHTQACMMVVHHTGKGDSELARGNSSLRAAMDTEMVVRPLASNIEIACTKQKDAAPFLPSVFNLSVIELCKDEDGEAVESCVPVQIVINDMVAEDQKRKGVHEDSPVATKEMGKNQRIAVDWFVGEIERKRKANPDSEVWVIEQSTISDGLDPKMGADERRRQIKWLVGLKIIIETTQLTQKIDIDALNKKAS